MDIPFEEILNKIKCNNYSVKKIFIQDSKIKLIEISSDLQGYDFFIEIPNSKDIQDHNLDSEELSIIEQTENDYKNHRQREYLENINKENIVCRSTKNLTIKNKNIYRCFLIDNFLPSDSENISELEDDQELDIIIDDFKVENILPIFYISFFINNIDNFSGILTENYQEITEQEEIMNEKEVIELLEKFDQQKTKLKQLIFDIHQNAYNLRRDISKTSDNLKRIYELKNKSINSSDRIRFKIDRMALEMQEKINNLKYKLSKQRNKADSLLKNYWDYISKYNDIE